MIACHRLSTVLALALALVAGPAAAQAPAVVGIHAEVPADARTAPHLGTRRSGSGVVVDASGLVVTAGYLIVEASTVQVLVEGGRPIPADVVAYDYQTGFGLLRAREALGVQPIALGQSDDIEPGEPVLVAAFSAVGGARPALVTRIRDFAGYWEYLLDDAVFTSPPHPGFAGAALLGRDGRLLGIGTLLVPDAGVPGAQLPGNMFLPVGLLADVLGELLLGGRSDTVPSPWMGVHTREVNGLVFVTRVTDDGPAERAGITVGDLIVAVSGQSVAGQIGFYRQLRAAGPAGTEVDLAVLRKDRMVEMKVRTADRYDWLLPAAAAP